MQMLLWMIVFGVILVLSVLVVAPIEGRPEGVQIYARLAVCLILLLAALKILWPEVWPE